ncbi:hypothetical protein Tcan_02138 [Toxocara canis]|uniref:Uncharacterized protein n=1 Tax=Toxocara canis TaxID=6265 RepID=A0A0B2UKT0_TOXCA|nr:hypothetical protein Tcan_02138 [Toxocara canis]
MDGGRPNDFEDSRDGEMKPIEDGDERLSPPSTDLQIDRQKIEAESTSTGDLAVLTNAGVTVYNATTLEEGLLAQATRTFDRIDSKTGKADPETRLQNVIGDVSSSVRYGDFTPFEAVQQDLRPENAENHGQQVTLTLNVLLCLQLCFAHSMKTSYQLDPSATQ